MGIHPRRRTSQVATTIKLSWALRQRLEQYLLEEGVSLGEFTRGLWRQALQLRPRGLVERNQKS